MPPTDDSDSKRLLANGQPEPSAAGESCGFGLGRLPKNGAPAATAEGANFGAAEAAANGEQGAEGGAPLSGFRVFRLFNRGEGSNSKVFGCCVKNDEFVHCGPEFGAKKLVWASS